MDIAMMLYRTFGYFEKDRSQECHGIYISVACAHPPPIKLNGSSDIRGIPHSIVELRKIRSDENTIIAGKCETCGKIYYKRG